MFVAQKVYTNGKMAENGWIISHLRPIGDGEHQYTPLGFVRNNNEDTWTELRRALPGLVALEAVTVPAHEFSRLQETEETPDHMRRVADAVEGN